MSNRQPLDALVDALLGTPGASERARLARLCKRLGIDPDQDETQTWALVGRALAEKEKEFQIRRRQGRPRKAISIDDERKRIVAGVQADMAAIGQKVTKEQILTVACEEKHPLFQAAPQTLKTSVSSRPTKIRKKSKLINS